MSISLSVRESFESFAKALLARRDRLRSRIKLRLNTHSDLDFNLRGWLEFPSHDQLYPVLMSAYYASLESYERRGVELDIVWLHPALGRGYIFKPTSSDEQIDVPTLRRYAQASSGAAELGIRNGKDSLVIEGLCGLNPSAIWTGSTVGPFGQIRISIRSPGHIEYREPGLSYSYVRGIARRSRHILRNSIVSSWLTTAESQSHGASPTNTAKMRRGWLTKFFLSLLREVECKKHGGTVVVLPNQVPKSIKLSYGGTSTCLSHLADELALVDKIESRNAGQVAEETPNNDAIEKEKTNSAVLSLWLSDMEDILKSSIDIRAHEMAGLAQCDGAVVFDNGLRLLGFGGIIQSSQPLSSNIPEFIQNAGTRHKSAFWLCEQVPGAIVLVVSSDGGVTLIHGTTSGADVYRNLSVI